MAPVDYVNIIRRNKGESSWIKLRVYLLTSKANFGDLSGSVEYTHKLNFIIDVVKLKRFKQLTGILRP